MRANQRMVASDGYEVALFPFEYLYMSQDEGGDFSHSGTYNIDLLGWGANGRVYDCPFYAPCSMRCVDVWAGYTGGNTRVWQSLDRVHLADGSLDFLTIYFSHDENPIFNLGSTVQQGQLCGHTGSYGNVTGDHTHTCCGKGTYDGVQSRPPNNNQDLKNRIHYWDALYVNDTIIVQGFNHNWITYQDDITPPGQKERKNFPFVLYAQKLRSKAYF